MTEKLLENMNEGTEFNPRGSDWLPEAGDP